jgi:glucose/arabinose dehydrogenase
LTALLSTVLLSALAACGDLATLPVAAGTGTQPVLPPPQQRLIPTVHVAPAIGWAPGATPVPAPGLQVAAFARGLDHPRWLLALPNGDVLVAETNAPAHPDAPWSFKRWVASLVMQRAGATVPSANRITLLRDADGDGVAEVRSVLLDGLNSPFGMALVGDQLFVANTDAVLRFHYATGATRITAPGVPVVALPAGAINHHWTKNLIANADGRKLYVTVGSNSNVAENGLDAEAGRATILEIDLASGTQRPYATGLRNPNGLAWRMPKGGGAAVLWTVVNERDELGSDLVPDYLSAVQDGGFYGWPYSYHGSHVDPRVQPPRPDLVSTAFVPDYAMGPHVAPLGLATSIGTTLPAAFADGLFVGLHGSWNRRPHSGYQVVFVPFVDGRPTGLPVEVLGRFLDAKGRAQGRPVGVALDRSGALLVADDVGNAVWRVSAAAH